MTANEAITGMKIVLRADANEKRWTEDEMIFALNVALRFYSNQLINSASRRYYKVGTLTTVAGTDTVALPSDSNGMVEYVKYNKELLKPTYISGMLNEPSSSTPRRIAVIDDDLLIYPTPAGAYTLTIGYWRDVTKVTPSTLDVEMDFPDQLSPLIMYDAAMFCALKHEAYITDIKALRDEWYDNLTYFKSERLKLGSYAARNKKDIRTLR